MSTSIKMMTGVKLDCGPIHSFKSLYVCTSLCQTLTWIPYLIKMSKTEKCVGLEVEGYKTFLTRGYLFSSIALSECEVLHFYIT